jgi:pyridoxine 5-phosphate synthase
MPDLCVNIDHVATIRQARRAWEPDPVWAAVEVQLGGAAGVTFHLREDRRHMQDGDLDRLKEVVTVRLNMEMAATREMVQIACALQPQMAMLVPEGRQEITTEGGLDVAGQRNALEPAIKELRDAGIPASAFIDAEAPQIEAAAECGFNVCELHTGPYAEAFHANGREISHPAVQLELEKLRESSRQVMEAGMMCNAGHALNYANVHPVATIDGLSELHIGHSIVSRSVFTGIQQATRDMINCMNGHALTGKKKHHDVTV